MVNTIGNWLPIIIGLITGGIISYFTQKIYQIKKKQADTDREISLSNKKIADLKFDSLQKEVKFQKEAYKKISDISEKIATDISQQLIDNQSWLDRFMDETGATYSGSVFGKRIRHFYYEKKTIAVRAVDEVEKYLDKSDLKHCLLIDSGTTLYPFFHELVERLNGKNGKKWRENICVITNNLPGVQYIMKNCKTDLDHEYQNISFNCLLIPGKPLSVYGAVTGKESEIWIKERINKYLQNELKWEKRNYKIFGFVTGNYIAAQWKNSEIESFYPVARGEGHVEIKTKIVEVSDKIFLLSPMMKFSFADRNLLNNVNHFHIERMHEDSKLNPSRVKYDKVIIDKEKCIFITTSRDELSHFHEFSKVLNRKLRALYGKKNVILVDYDLKKWIPAKEKIDIHEIEIEKEIPHDNLRKEYGNGKDIWEYDWVEGMITKEAGT